jgi:hypothetical protein
VTKKDAAVKVAKLRRLADDPRTPPTEADVARRQIDKLSAEHGLAPLDLETGRLCAAFDDLVGEIEKLVARHPNVPSGLFGTTKVVNDVLGKIRDIDDADKATKLRQLVSIVRIASLFAGDTKIVSELKVVIDTTLKNHDFVI